MTNKPVREQSSSQVLPKRILMVRLDRIGDLVLTLPIDQALTHADVRWWIPKGLSFITDAAEPPRHTTEILKDVSLSQFLQLLKCVRKARFEACVIFHAPWWVSLLTWLAGIRLRIGVKSQWHSLLFLNRAVRQKRSRAECSELEYNYRLVEDGLRIERGSLPRMSLPLRSPFNDFQCASLLSQYGLTKNRFYVVHPGMSGSALNWPTDHYLQLITLLSEQGPVAITGTPSDEEFLKPLRAPLRGNANVMWLDGKLSGPELISVLSSAKAVVAPSTGVMHLAASTGSRTLGLFSPVRVQQPLRWGPQGAQTKTLKPNVVCPGELRFLGEVCPHYTSTNACMNQITPTQVLEELRGW